MEVEYELTPEDAIAFHRYYHSHPHMPPQQGPPNPISRVVWYLVPLVVAILLYFAASENYALLQQISLYFVAVFAGAALTLFGILIYGRIMSPKLIRKSLYQGRNAEKTLGRRRLSIDAEAVRNMTDFASVAYYWKGIDKIVMTKDYALVFINTATAFTLPRRIFADDRAFNDFVETARRYRRMAGVGEAVQEVMDEGEAWERRGATGIQAPDQSGKSGRVEGIIPKEGDLRQG
jgi:hypothetical protein